MPLKSLPYIGVTPHSYALALAMVLPDGPGPPLIGVVTGAPFGVWMREADGFVFFTPPGWDSDKGLRDAMDVLGWACDLTSGGSAEEAIDRLRAASARGPVLAGPFEMGLMLHHPGSGKAIGADHFLIVTAVTEDTVHFHDPHGFAHALMPIPQFAAAWVADTVGYRTQPYTMRSNFRRVESVDDDEALRRSLPTAMEWLARTTTASESGELAGAAACERLADNVQNGLSLLQYDQLGRVGIRIGARRLADTAMLLEQIGAVVPATIADDQARLVGAMQYPLIMRDRLCVAQLLRELAPSYQRLYTALAEYVNATPQSQPRVFERV